MVTQTDRMAIDLDKPTLQQVLKLATQLNTKHRLKIVSELVATLDSEQLEDLVLAVEEAITLRAILGEEFVCDHQPKGRKKIEIKHISGRSYAYVRWRDRSHSDQYLGPLPFLPGKTYRLTHKLDGSVKVFTVLDCNLDDEEQPYLLLEQIEPYPAKKRYRYPECLKQVFHKRQWTVEILPVTPSVTPEVTEQVGLASRASSEHRPVKYILS